MTNASPAAAHRGGVLCVDLDGSLISTDSLIETFFLFVRRHPRRLVLIPLWLLRGRAFLKMRLSEVAAVPVETLPWNGALIEYIRERKAGGSLIVLATGADRAVAERVASHLGFFDAVWASDGAMNLTGVRKAALLAREYLDFDYVGNSRADLPVWLRSRHAIVVSSSGKLMRDLEAAGIPATPMPFARSARVRAWLRAMRVYQWCKNLLVFLPLLTSHRLMDGAAVGHASIAFFAFSLGASGTYLINDLFDLQSDRAHSRKKSRPFASGVLSSQAGLAAATALFGACLAAAAALPAAAGLLVAGYVVLTLAYSLRLKRYMVVDVLLLVCFYLLRIFAGGLATGIVISVWLLSFSVFFFLALALIKRLTELRTIAGGAAGDWTASARGYRKEDVPLIGSLAGSSAYLSVVLLALYINSPEVQPLYRHPQFLWPVCLLVIYWLTRTLLLANRGELHDDPIVFALQDRASQVTAFSFLVFLYIAH